MADYDVDVHYIKEFDDIEKFILKNCKKNDLLITMGAGNVDSIGNSLVNRQLSTLSTDLYTIVDKQICGFLLSFSTIVKSM